MPLSPLSPKAQALIKKPEVLLCAWDKLNDWYRGELRPEPEYSRFAVNPIHELSILADEIASGEYNPNTFPLVPFPKKGGEIRHYTSPAVRDQLAFMIFGVILAPMFEARFSNASLGNRWYRKVVLKSSRAAEPKWVNKPFSLSDKNLNQSYARSYGLFRRIAHWRARNIIKDFGGVQAESDDLLGNPDNYDPELIAYQNEHFARPDFSNDENTAYYARLDLSKAYPCVNRNALRSRAEEIIRTVLPIRTLNTAYHPKSIWADLEAETHHKTALELTSRLMETLQAVEYAPGDVGQIWLAAPESPESTGTKSNDGAVYKHLTGVIASNKFGLPTGLAISGFLFNVYLDDFDTRIRSSLRKPNRELKGVYLRFVDDIILIGHKKQALLELLHTTNDYFEASNSDLGLHISIQKAKPPEVSEFIGNRLSQSSIQMNSPAWSKCAITRHNLGEFVTDLVEQLSELGGETADELLGEHGELRLQQLHDLIRVDRKDAEVKDDTRISFAAFKLSRHPIAFWNLKEGRKLNGDDAIGLVHELREIRKSITQAIHLAPWKHRIWNAALIAYCRQIGGDPSTIYATENNKWLKDLLKKLAVGGAWEKNYPDQKRKTGSTEAHKLSTSFLRTCFWVAWADTVRSVASICPGQTHAGKWGPDHWAWFLIPEDNREGLFKQLSNIELWAKALYGETQFELPPWESRALATAFWTVADTSTTMLAAAATDDFNDPIVSGSYARFLVKNKLSAKTGACSAASILRHSCHAGEITEETVLELWSAFPRVPFAHRFSVFSNLRFLSQLSANGFIKICRDGRSPATDITPKAWTPYYYQMLRLESLAHNSIPTALTRQALNLFPDWKQLNDTTDDIDVYWLLWSIPDFDTVRPASAPSIGLPAGIVICMLKNALSASHANKAYSWVLNTDSRKFLTWGRSEQLRASPNPKPPNTSDRLIMPSSSSWLPPHPAFALNNSNGWRNCLVSLVAMSGNERILDKILGGRGEPIDFVDRFEWRNIISAPLAFWQAMEAMLLSDRGAVLRLKTAIKDVVDTQLLAGLTPSDKTDELQRFFNYIRIDVDLSSGRQSETPIGPSGRPPKREDSDKNHLDSILVRMAQLKEVPPSDEIIDQWPNLTQKTSQKLYCELIDALPDTGKQKGASGRPQLVIFPEAYLPHGNNYVNRLKKTVRKRNLGLLTGMYWHEVPFGVAPARGVKSINRYFSNEALLLVPISHKPTDRPYIMREFIIPKPLPAITEYALAEVITSKKSTAKRPTNWQILPGAKWHRFIHPFWGNFSVAICSDILDPVPWAHLRKDIQHLFLIACNSDVDLYQSLTWTRAYECYVNMVAVNHGFFGGSFSWTPKHLFHKELAVLKGSRLRVVVDVNLSVRDLAHQQSHGWAEQLEIHKKEWLREKHDKPKWKAPPHFFKLD